MSKFEDTIAKLVTDYQASIAARREADRQQFIEQMAKTLRLFFTDDVAQELLAGDIVEDDETLYLKCGEWRFRTSREGALYVELRVDPVHFKDVLPTHSGHIDFYRIYAPYELGVKFARLLEYRAEFFKRVERLRQTAKKPFAMPEWVERGLTELQAAIDCINEDGFDNAPYSYQQLVLTASRQDDDQ